MADSYCSIGSIDLYVIPLDGLTDWLINWLIDWLIVQLIDWLIDLTPFPFSPSAAAIFVVTFFLLGFNVLIALIVTFTVALIVTNLIGLMYLWNISLNAVSLVNLVMVSPLVPETDLKTARTEPMLSSANLSKTLEKKALLSPRLSSAFLTLRSFRGVPDVCSAVFVTRLTCAFVSTRRPSVLQSSSVRTLLVRSRSTPKSRELRGPGMRSPKSEAR